MERRQLLCQVLAVGAGAVAGCQAPTTATGEQSEAATSNCQLESGRQQQIRVGDHALGTTEYGNLTRIRGTITNTGSAPVTYVEIEATFYAENGSVLRTGVDRRINLAPGETQTFRVYPDRTVDPAAVGSYDLTLAVVEACVPT